MSLRLIGILLMRLKSGHHIDPPKFLTLKSKNIIIRKMPIVDSILLISQCESITRNVQVHMAILADTHFKQPWKDLKQSM